MASTQQMICPVCGTEHVVTSRSSRGADVECYACAACGTYTLTGTTAAMLASRLQDSPDARKRLSYRLRRATDQHSPITLNSVTLDELLALPGPTAEEQIRAFLELVRSLTGGDHFAPAILHPGDFPSAIAATGVKSEAALMGLTHDAEVSGYIWRSFGGTRVMSVRLTEKGREFLATGKNTGAGGEVPDRQVPKRIVSINLDDSKIDEVLRGLLKETHAALDLDLLALPMMGARATFDRAMDLKLGRDYGTFAAKLKAMRGAGHVDTRVSGILENMIDAGSATAHRGWQPDRETVLAVMREVEYAVWDWFARDQAASVVRAVTPPRPPRRRSS